MANIRSRVDRLEGRGSHGKVVMHLLRNVKVRKGESLKSALSRAAKKAGIDPEDVGYVSLEHRPSHLQLEYDGWLGHNVRVNGYEGPVEKLQGWIRDGLPPREWWLKIGRKRYEQLEALKAWRYEKDYSEAKAAKALGLKRKEYSLIEEGDLVMPKSVIEAIGIEGTSR